MFPMVRLRIGKTAHVRSTRSPSTMDGRHRPRPAALQRWFSDYESLAIFLKHLVLLRISAADFCLTKTGPAGGMLSCLVIPTGSGVLVPTPTPLAKQYYSIKFPFGS